MCMPSSIINTNTLIQNRYINPLYSECQIKTTCAGSTQLSTHENTWELCSAHSVISTMDTWILLKSAGLQSPERSISQFTNMCCHLMGSGQIRDSGTACTSKEIVFFTSTGVYCSSTFLARKNVVLCLSKIHWSLQNCVGYYIETWYYTEKVFLNKISHQDVSPLI